MPAMKKGKASTKKSPVKKASAKKAPAETKKKETKTELKPFAGIDYNAIADDIESKLDLTSVHLSRGSYVEDVVSTGSLSYDLITGGGWAPGRWITLFGPEASGKSSFLYFSMKDALDNGIFMMFFDHEGSTDAYYLSRILQIKNLDHILGMRDEDGAWVVTPKMRYYQSDVGEVTFRAARRMLKALPDKVQTRDGWFRVYKASKKNQGLYSGQYSPILFKKTGKLWIPAEDGGKPQALFFKDSYPMMFPEARDEDDEKSPMAQQARMFSQNMPMVRTLLQRKRAIVIGVNQLRLKPMVMYGSPEYEPCGEAPKFLSDIRTRVGTISVPHAKGMIEEEDCWDGNGIDRYRYFKARTIKNKVFSPFREITLRHWFETQGKPGSGICPVWDTRQFLMETGQMQKKKGGYIITLDGPWRGVKISWQEFKRFILDPDRVAVFDELGFDKDKLPKSGKGKGKKTYNERLLKKAMDIRAVCKGQLTDSSAFDKYFRTVGGVNPDEKDIRCETCANWKTKKGKCMKTEATDKCKKWELA